MNKSKLALLVLALTLFSGCTAKLAPETKIPQAPKIEKIDKDLSIETQRKIRKEYFKYQDSLVTGLITMGLNASERSDYKDSLTIENTNMQKEKVYECNISKKFGNYEKHFLHTMFLVSNLRKPTAPLSIGINNNNVEEFLVYKGFSIKLFTPTSIDSDTFTISLLAEITIII